MKRLTISPPPHEKAKKSGQPFNWRAPWGDRAPPEWAVLVLGCTIGLCSGASVVLFNLTVRVISLYADRVSAQNNRGLVHQRFL